MSKVFVGQIDLKIQLDPLLGDISDATVMQICYKKPETNTIGAWTATRDATNEKIFYILQAGDINEGGTWRFWVKIDGKIGSIKRIMFYAEGED